MPKYRVRWEELKSIVVEADDEYEAKLLAHDVFYDKATLDDSNDLDTIENPPLLDDEKVWTYAD